MELTLTLFVGPPTSEVADAAKKHDSTAYIIDLSNCNQNHYGVCYTSLGDLRDEFILAKLFEQASIIIYIPSAEWINNKKVKRKTEQFILEEMLFRFSLDKNKKILNLPKNTYWPSITSSASQSMIKLADHRKTENCQLWTAGCSITYGFGVTESDRYANLLAEKLNLTQSVLAEYGSSITWATDQIIRSDIRSGDIVVWGITSHLRFPFWDENKEQINHIHPGYYVWTPNFAKTISLDYLSSPTLKYEAIRSIYQVNNYCKKISAKLILVGLLPENEIGEYLNNNFTNYIHLAHYNLDGINTRFLDIATDLIHPGPITHQWYADQIYNFIINDKSKFI
jgi:hypothetical protein